MARYYLQRNGQKHGPYLLHQMHEFISAGEIGPREMVSEEGSSQWIPAAQFTLGTTTQLRPGMPSAKAHAEGARVVTVVTHNQVKKAYRRLKLPLIGMLISITIPAVPWALKWDVDRSLTIFGKLNVIKELVQQYAHLLPLLIGLGAIATLFCIIWLIIGAAKARALKKEFKRINP